MEANDAFDISKEPEWVHEMYGTKPGRDGAFSRQ